ncbi:MAG: hypothetical protein M1825_005252 [Sarcosagium campestre]|nr:MAG: hypothetical protein M1825_005252 [Sarcosagium campestre]
MLLASPQGRMTRSRARAIEEARTAARQNTNGKSASGSTDASKRVYLSRGDDKENVAPSTPAPEVTRSKSKGRTDRRLASNAATPRHAAASLPRPPSIGSLLSPKATQESVSDSTAYEEDELLGPKTPLKVDLRRASDKLVRVVDTSSKLSWGFATPTESSKQHGKPVPPTSARSSPTIAPASRGSSTSSRLPLPSLTKSASSPAALSGLTRQNSCSRPSSDSPSTLSNKRTGTISRTKTLRWTCPHSPTSGSTTSRATAYPRAESATSVRPSAASSSIPRPGASGFPTASIGPLNPSPITIDTTIRRCSSLSDISSHNRSPPTSSLLEKSKTPIPSSQTTGPLSGAVVHVEVYTNEGEEAGEPFRKLLTSLGARCVQQWKADSTPAAEVTSPPAGKSRTQTPPVRRSSVRLPGRITHVVYKAGGKRTLEKLRKSDGTVKCVNVQWTTACAATNSWVPEHEYLVDMTDLPRGGRNRRKSMVPTPLNHPPATLGTKLLLHRHSTSNLSSPRSTFPSPRASFSPTFGSASVSKSSSRAERQTRKTSHETDAPPNGTTSDVQQRLFLARRQTLQYAPEYNSPLARCLQPS